MAKPIQRPSFTDALQVAWQRAVTRSVQDLTSSLEQIQTDGAIILNGGIPDEPSYVNAFLTIDLGGASEGSVGGGLGGYVVTNYTPLKTLDCSASPTPDDVLNLLATAINELNT